LILETVVVMEAVVRSLGGLQPPQDDIEIGMRTNGPKASS